MKTRFSNSWIFQWGSIGFNTTVNKNSSKSKTVNLPIAYATFGLVIGALSHEYISVSSSVQGNSNITVNCFNCDNSSSNHSLTFCVYGSTGV